MKELYTNLFLVLVLSVMLSASSGCGGAQQGASQLPEGQKTANGINNNAVKKSSEYPALAAAVANAEIRNIDGTTFKVADRKGKVVLLNMWATWCGPCRQEMPSLVRMETDHRDQGFEVIGLNTDEETVEDINKFAAAMKPPLNYRMSWADTNLQKELLNISRFPGIPQSFLIDRDGNLRGVFKGANPADIRKMEELVAKVVRGDETTPVTDVAEPTANKPPTDVNGNPSVKPTEKK